MTEALISAGLVFAFLGAIVVGLLRGPTDLESRGAATKEPACPHCFFFATLNVKPGAWVS
jgi:hypothetical protein